MTTDIFISNAAGYVPTVNQLERTTAHIGYNRVDAILYGLKVVGGVKTVVVLNFGAEPHEQHDRLHSMNSALDHAAVAEADRGKIPQANAVTGEWELVAMPSAGVTPTDGILDWDTDKYTPYAAKKASDPGYAYFYSDTGNPTFTNRLNIDGQLYAYALHAHNYGGGYGVEGRSAGGIGGYFFSTNNLGAEIISGLPVEYNSISNVLKISKGCYNTNAPAAGIGAGISIFILNSARMALEAGNFACKFTDVTPAAEDSSFEWSLRSAGSKARKMALSDVGKLTLDTYGDGLHTGTATKWLAVDVDGNMIEETAPVQYWQRNGTTLSPATAGDDINTAGVIKSLSASSPYINSYLANGASGVSNLDAYAQQYYQRANTSGSIGANEELSRLMIGGVHSSSLKDAITIIATSGNAWSGSSLGASYDILSIANDSISLYSRIKITADGYVVINEDGRPTWLRVEGDTDSHLFEVDGVTDRVGVGTGGSVDTKFHVKTQSDWTQEAVKIEQVDQDQAFVDYAGTSASDTTKNICTMNGGGSLSGPRLNNGVDPGFAYAGMIKIEVNGTAYWTPYYSIDTP